MPLNYNYHGPDAKLDVVCGIKIPITLLPANLLCWYHNLASTAVQNLGTCFFLLLLIHICHYCYTFPIIKHNNLSTM